MRKIDMMNYAINRIDTIPKKYLSNNIFKNSWIADKKYNKYKPYETFEEFKNDMVKLHEIDVKNDKETYINIRNTICNHFIWLAAHLAYRSFRRNIFADKIVFYEEYLSISFESVIYAIEHTSIKHLYNFYTVAFYNFMRRGIYVPKDLIEQPSSSQYEISRIKCIKYYNDIMPELYSEKEKNDFKTIIGVSYNNYIKYINKNGSLLGQRIHEKGGNYFKYNTDVLVDNANLENKTIFNMMIEDFVKSIKNKRDRYIFTEYVVKGEISTRELGKKLGISATRISVKVNTYLFLARNFFKDWYK